MRLNASFGYCDPSHAALVASELSATDEGIAIDLCSPLVSLLPNMQTRSRLQEMGARLPAEAKVPPGVVIDFAWARVYGDRVYLSGHGPQATDGAIIGPLGRVGAEVSPEEATEAARLAALLAIASLKRAIGSRDRVVAWVRVDGFVLSAPGFDRTTNVVNGSSRLIIEAFGENVGLHPRTAMGVAATNS